MRKSRISCASSVSCAGLRRFTSAGKLMESSSVPIHVLSRESRASKVKSPLHGGLRLRLRLLLVYLCEGSDPCSVRCLGWGGDCKIYEPGRGGKCGGGRGRYDSQ